MGLSIKHELLFIGERGQTGPRAEGETGEGAGWEGTKQTQSHGL